MNQISTANKWKRKTYTSQGVVYGKILPENVEIGEKWEKNLTKWISRIVWVILPILVTIFYELVSGGIKL